MPDSAGTPGQPSWTASVSDATKTRTASLAALEQLSIENNPYDVKKISDNGNLAVDREIAEVVDGKITLRRMSEVSAE